MHHKGVGEVQMPGYFGEQNKGFNYVYWVNWLNYRGRIECVALFKDSLIKY